MAFFMKKSFGFTLAEVLITLGIIGIVAEITIPTLYNGFVKQQTVTLLQKFYTNINQAIKLSEVDNGPSNSWNWPSDDTGVLTWFNTYLEPYIKYTQKYTHSGNGYTYVKFIDGTFMYMGGANSGIGIDFNFFEKNNPQIQGRTVFAFHFYNNTAAKAFKAYDIGLSGNPNVRSTWQTGDLGCNSASTNKAYCTGLIMYDGWQIKGDYPFFN